MMAIRRFLGWFLVLAALWSLPGCAALPAVVGLRATPSRTPFRPVAYTPTPSTSPAPTHSPPSDTPTPIPSPTPQVIGFWAADGTPDGLKAAVTLPAGWEWVESPEQAAVKLEPVTDTSLPPITWVYALAAPFPTVLDGVSLQDLQRAWRGESHQPFDGKPLLLSQDTLRVFTAAWGEPRGDVSAVDADGLVQAAWDSRTWCLVPFERLEPRLKVLRVDGSSPLARGDLQAYPLRLGFRLTAGMQSPDAFQQAGGSLPAGNRDPSKMTVILMTGTTALVRATAWRMEGLGLSYPARDIMDWLQEPDFTHISNEASFNPACPKADPNQTSLMFCSRPEYIQLLDAIGADIIELSGNHNNDWGRDAFDYSLELFRQRGWRWFAGGENSQEAEKPLLLEHNGNRIAFVGCNLAGPPAAWATDTLPGAARCDLDAYAAKLGDLRAQGYLPVMTFQYNEIYVPYPSERQEVDFRRMADAGAVIVSGSQAHFPQGFAFESGELIHYGLGNLFFDQMDVPVVGTRREFLDRHVFYNGRHISTELLTAMLEDYARPRPMTEEERAAFLAEIFAATGW